jgi:orotidine-5'-phosphate decarboxylase
VIVALDFADAKTAFDLTEKLDPAQCKVKVGKELFTAAGPSFVQQLVRYGFGVFLDLKFHDIPNTVASACRTAAQLGVWMMNVHALGGRAMLEAARVAIPAAQDSPKLVAVTVLTSMTAAEVAEVGLTGHPSDAVLRLALLAKECHIDGVVCSALEAAALREACGDHFWLVTPGIRFADSAADDQQRITTASVAIAAGANYLVIGRPITRAADPLRALERFNREIAGRMPRP